MKVIVTQYGARRRYLVPQILSENNLLQYLYTDSYKESILGKIVFWLSKIGIRNTSLDRLQKRDPQLPKKEIRANDCLQLKLFFYKMVKASNEKIIEAIFEGNSACFIKWGCEGADWLYSMYIETFEYTKYAKMSGVKILTDIYENPYIFKTLAEEIERLPELKCISYLKEEFLAQYKIRTKYMDQLLKIADQYLIPSEYVKEALRQSSSFDESKVNIVPYVSSVINSVYNNNPVKGRLIWIGNEPVRKGLVYSLRAVKKLKKKYPYIDFRVIGPMPQEIIKSEDFIDLNFIGYLNKEQLKDEFIKADMYVFPTLAEGFAGSLLEAASFGVPIITTHASGFGDDFPGIFVEEKNVNDIVCAVSNLLDDREKRDSISREIFDYSQLYNKSYFKDKLLTLLI